MLWKAAFVLFTFVWRAAGLECFSCTDASDLSACNITERCHDGQACFHNSKGQVSTLGCTEYQNCGVHGNIQSSIIGREIQERQTHNCFECCSTDNCNKNLCEHLKPTLCIDDESIDCAKLNSLFGICSDVNHAKTVCPKFCGLCNVVDGAWSAWTSWSQCDVTCENGTQSRARQCNNPVPKNGGLNCQGFSTEMKTCLRELCPVHGGWSSWEPWKSCSTSCGIGLQNRIRNCSNPIPQRNGQHCFGHNIDVRQCMSRPCANGGWSKWGQWSPCSVTCGVGVRSKSRSCTNPHPSPYGLDCIGKHFELQSCTSSCGSFCSSNPCIYGRCYDLVHDYLCLCTHGYEGRNCNISSSYCQPDPCVYGTCIELVYDFSCTCDKGFEGRFCNISNSACMSSPCLHGTCYDNNRDYLCVCDDGFMGKQCNSTKDLCSLLPCMRGTCINNRDNFTCLCPPGVTGYKCESIPATDCYDILEMNLGSKSGIYWIKLWQTREHIEVLCDLETADGGWTVFQRRINGSVDFYRNFANYSGGFGNLKGEFWLGLHYIYEMTSQSTSELRLDLMAVDGTKAFELYPRFYLSPGSAYTLHIGTGIGTAGDSGQGLSYSNGADFFTYDHESSNNCGSKDHGGWWYSGCTHVNLNGEYVTPGTKDSTHAEAGVIYRDFQGEQSLQHTQMMFRRTKN